MFLRCDKLRKTAERFTHAIARAGHKYMKQQNCRSHGRALLKTRVRLTRVFGVLCRARQASGNKRTTAGSVHKATVM